MEALDTDLLVWVGDQLEKLADQLDAGMESHNVYLAVPRVIKRLRKIASQLPPCSPEQFANALGTALDRQGAAKRKA